MLQWLWEDSPNIAVKWLPLNNCAFSGNLSLLDGNIALHTLHAAYGEYSLQTLFNWIMKDCVAHAWMTVSCVVNCVLTEHRGWSRAMQGDNFSPFGELPIAKGSHYPVPSLGTDCTSIFTSPCWVVILHCWLYSSYIKCAYNRGNGFTLPNPLHNSTL